jgi:hypothetical protein
MSIPLKFFLVCIHGGIGILVMLAFCYGYLRYITLLSTKFIIIMYSIFLLAPPGFYLPLNIYRNLEIFYKPTISHFISSNVLNAVVFLFLQPAIMVGCSFFYALCFLLFAIEAWFRFRDYDKARQPFLKFLLIRWFLLFQLPFLIAFPFIRDEVGYDSELYKDIPYEYSLSNAQFCMDLNLALLLVSIPVSLLFIGWLHTRYCRRNGLLPE